MLTFSCFYDEWLFVRRFSFIHSHTDRVAFTIKPKENWRLFPKKTVLDSTRIPFLMLDNDGIMINIENKEGTWARIPRSTIKTISLYFTVHPWSSLLFSKGDNSEVEEDKTKHYFMLHQKQYRLFHEPFQLLYEDQLSLIIEHTFGHSQIPLPLSWLSHDTLLFFLDETQRSLGLPIQNKEMLTDFF